MLEKHKDAYKIDALPLLHSTRVLDACMVNAQLPSDTWSLFSYLKRVDVSLDQLELGDVAALCSALRYGSRLESLSISGDVAHLSTKYQVQSWRWLVFGVFYPRSKKLDKDNRLRTISLSFVAKTRAAAVLDVFADPASALVYPGTASQGAATQTPRSILLCCALSSRALSSLQQRARDRRRSTHWRPSASSKRLFESPTGRAWCCLATASGG